MGAAEIEVGGLLSDVPRELVFVDLETTGGNVAQHRITEIGIVRVSGGEVIEEWSSLVNPECPIPAYIESFTGISNDMVASAPRFADLAPLVLEKLGGAVFAAHNARFDYSFLRSEFQRSGRHFSAKVLCTVKLSRRLFPQFVRHNLDAVMERHGLVCGARHRALGDAQVLRDFWFKLRREIPEPLLGSTTRALLGRPRLPACLPPDLADDLPEGPGVYRFFGDDEALLYVAKTHSLQSGVLANFTAGHSESKGSKLIDQVRRIDWIETQGELGAMLCEAEWVKAGKPLYNRRIKSKAGAFTLRRAATSSASQVARSAPIGWVAIDGLALDDLAQCFGVFHSQKDARKALTDIARAQQLCLKVLGLEDGEGSCFALQLGKCKGACIGKEPRMLHDLRLSLALSSLKFKPWPFPGRIALLERDQRRNRFDGTAVDDWHVLDHWSYLGTARCDEELAALAGKDAAGAFDVDIYRILVRYFANHPKLDWRDLRHDMRA